jgi:3-oxoadipate enol-lactonase
VVERDDLTAIVITPMHYGSMSERDVLEVPGGRLAYEVDGSGSALTLIHAGVANMRQWDNVVPRLAERHRVVRYDTRGFGATRSEEVEFSNRADLRALLDHLGIERTHLVGNSRGGTIALDSTIESPERIASLVLVGSTPSGFGHEAPEMDELWKEMERLYEAKDWEPLVEMEVALWLDGHGQSPERVDPAVRRQMTEWNVENYRNAPGDGKPQPLDPPAAGRLEQVRVPTLVTWGDLDEGGVLAGSEVMATTIPGAKRHVFPGVAHMVNLERPDEFARLVLDFVAEVEAR